MSGWLERVMVGSSPTVKLNSTPANVHVRTQWASFRVLHHARGLPTESSWDSSQGFANGEHGQFTRDRFPKAGVWISYTWGRKRVNGSTPMSWEGVAISENVRFGLKKGQRLGLQLGWCEAQQLGQLAGINLVGLITFFQQSSPSWITHHDFRDMRLYQVVQPRGPGSFFKT